jgi:type IV conjugative transfer system protein TraE
MRTENVNGQARVLNRRLTVLGGMLALSLVANAGMAVSVATQSKVVLVPTLVDSVEITGTGVDRDYLERLSRDVVYTYLNRTPESARYFERNLERITSPDTYQEIKSALIADRQARQQSQTSQVYYPVDFFVDPGKLYVEVTGDQLQMNNRQVISDERKMYALTFERRGALVQLKSIETLDRDTARGSRARPANTGEVL